MEDILIYTIGKRLTFKTWNMNVTVLDQLPEVDFFLGTDLKTGSMIIAAMGIVHPMAYGCTLFLPISYLLVSIWILVTIFFAASCLLFYGVANNVPALCTIWVWYALVFVVLMVLILFLLCLLFTSRGQRGRVLVVILGVLWYILSIYFIFVVNTYRKNLEKPHSTSDLLASFGQFPILSR